jgi:hypothetical protein
VDSETGIITRVAGKGDHESSDGDGGPALEATVMPVHFEVDDQDRIIFVDVEGNSVRMIDADGVISTVLDGDEHGVQPYDVALVGDGNLLVADHGEAPSCTSTSPPVTSCPRSTHPDVIE